MDKQTVLITGCSTGGIGWAMAKAFHERGYHVFATARDLSKTTDLSALTNIEIVKLDVTDEQAILNCRDLVAKRTGGKLDILVNNAGAEFQAPLLDVDIVEAKKLYDANVWGTLSMVQAFSPLLIESKGVIVNHSSIDAAMNMAWAGIFASSKAAETRLSETLRVELDPLGVRVVTAMCGSANTPMFNKPGGRMELPNTSYYYDVQEIAYKERISHQGKAMKVELLVNELVKDIIRGRKGVIWHGSFASFVKFASWALPTTLVDRMVNAERGLKLVNRR